ncbi:phosphatidylglycerol lysyltransferase domain-containing protein [Pseudalkalibacillus hwajinpoensis]|uniref:DUF2156 domain-containing protein n=1 Tax=Guptibacillus hwajinpoensis TaxID=208199 RepID=A0A4U1MLG4_9BACL|nr:phosphatidylglycerol lysyltransferase domain-containing protein [Pseudalkalibacillus hwajinpoensis]TKD72329.1 DUF2156 domain-containing protein [Pseudalkalibacillus hwajinpoensis]
MIYLKKWITDFRSPSYEPEFDVEQVSAFLKEHGGHHLSHLMLLKDKEIYWAQQGNVLIAYKQIANKLVVLGDPIGVESLVFEAMKEFCEYGENNGLTPVFYQVSPRYMAYYHELGYRFLKLGEESVMDLDGFSLAGKKGAKLRTRCNKFARNSFSFSVVHPPYTNELLSTLSKVSDSWLGDQKEKGFSVVSFNEEYVSSFPIALLYDPKGEVVAFATLATDYKSSVCIDLMRKRCDSPHGTMDVLFIHIFKWLKENDYRSCSLGMAPLSNVGNHKDAFMSEKLMRLAFNHANSFYNFKGLRDFKSKFTDKWEPKYLVYKNTCFITLFQLMLLINRSPVSQPKSVNPIRFFLKKTG